MNYYPKVAIPLMLGSAPYSRSRTTQCSWPLDAAICCCIYNKRSLKIIWKKNQTSQTPKGTKKGAEFATSAVRPLLSNSFGSEPRLSNWCNSRPSPLTAAKDRLRGKSILPRANFCSVSVKMPSIIGSPKSFKCYINHQYRLSMTKLMNEEKKDKWTSNCLRNYNIPEEDCSWLLSHPQH